MPRFQAVTCPETLRLAEEAVSMATGRASLLKMNGGLQEVVGITAGRSSHGSQNSEWEVQSRKLGSAKRPARGRRVGRFDIVICLLAPAFGLGVIRLGALART